MDSPKMKQTVRSRKSLPSKQERVRALLELLVEALDDKPAEPTWGWVHWSAWSRSQEHARKIARREGVRVTKIGRDLFGARVDLDALAERNARVSAAAEQAEEALDPEVLNAFGGAH